MANPHWLLACKEYQGSIHVTRLPVAIDDNTPGIPTQWYRVGPGLRPSVQKYLGNGATGTQFILTFEYVSHLFTRILDIATWPPTVVDPVTFNPTSIQLPEDAIEIKLLSNNEAPGNDTYFFNPILLKINPLFFDPLLQLFYVEIVPAVGWVPLFTPYAANYRVYRRPFGGSVWTLVQDWTPTLNYTEAHASILQFEYTATWGAGPNPNNPNVNNDYNEGIPGGFNATILAYDSTNPANQVDFTVSFTDPQIVAFNSTLEGFHADPSQRFLVGVGDDAISISNSSLENSTLAAPPGSLGTQPNFSIETQSDYLILNANAAVIQGSTLAAMAGMF